MLQVIYGRIFKIISTKIGIKFLVLSTRRYNLGYVAENIIVVLE